MIGKLLPHLQKYAKQGLSNQNYIGSYHGKRYIVKKFTQRSGDPYNEYRALQFASRKKLAPKPLYFDGEHLILPYLENKPSHTITTQEIRHLSQKLRTLHRLKPPQKSPSLKKLLSLNAYPLLNRTAHFTPDLAFIHGDLNPHNTLFSHNRLFFIDFKYATYGDIYFDLAAISIEFELNPIQKSFFCDTTFCKKDAILKSFMLLRRSIDA